MDYETIISGAGPLLLIAGVALWVVFIRLFLRVIARLPPYRPAFLREGLLLFAASFLLMNLMRMLLAGFSEKEGSSPSDALEAKDFLYPLLMVVVVMAVICLAALALLAYQRGREGLRATGFTLEKPGLHLVVALLAYVSFFPVYTLICLAVHEWIIPYEAQDIVQWMVDHPEYFRNFFVIFSTAILIPAVEEILFRGFLQSGLRAFMGPIPAVFLSAAAFGLAHEVQAMIPVFALGCMLGYLKERTGSLYPAMAMHTVHNALMLVMAAYAW